MGEIRIRAIEPSYLDFYWGRIFPQVRDALKYTNNEQSPFHIYTKIASGEYILLVVLDGEEVVSHVTLQKADLPNKKIIVVVTCGGDRMSEWLSDILEVIESIGKDQSCEAIHIIGRKGWAKALTEYKQQYVVCTKEINYG